MIILNNISNEIPYKLFQERYHEALDAGQKSIEAMSISSFNKDISEVESRYVNLKSVIDKDFIFFSNYNSPKAIAFNSHNQISALFYWQSINLQIRIKANIKKTSREYNNHYFRQRSIKKNALAISSMQSNKIASYEEVIRNYNLSLEEENLKECPIYWGGYSFLPYSFEFWEGSKYRLNKRNLYYKSSNRWIHNILEP